jgi:hypothetical protein
MIDYKKVTLLSIFIMIFVFGCASDENKKKAHLEKALKVIRMKNLMWQELSC